MRNILVTLLFFSVVTGYASELINAKLLKKGSADTLNIQLEVSVYWPKNVVVNVLSFKGTLKIYIDGEKEKLKEGEVDYLVFTDPLGKTREFVSDNYTGRLKMDRVMFERMYVGKISWYRDYYVSPGTTNPSCVTDYFVNERSASPGVNCRKELILRTKDMPELKAKIKKIKTDDDILAILILYNQGSN